jgi:SAM-dependent methyltransferase
VFPLPRASCVDRVEFLRSAARGRRVAHLGFWDEGSVRSDLEARGLWLHAQLAEVASELVGIDVSEAGVAQARHEGFEAHVADCRDGDAVAKLGLRAFDLVIAGELIEHLDAPGEFLDGVGALVAQGGELIVTTPNAASFTGPLTALRGVEVINPDHVTLYSWYTLTNLLQRHGWRVTRFATYPARPSAIKPRSIDATVARTVARIERLVARWRPFVASGLIAVTTQSPGDGA